MKKLLLIFCLTTISTITFAQSVNFGIKAGFNYSRISVTAPPFSLNNKGLLGLHIGGFFDAGFGNFAIQPGLFFTTKGGETTVLAENINQQTLDPATVKNTLYYIEVPVNLLYKIHATPGFKLYFGGGPYIGYGVSSSFSENDPGANIHISGSTKFSYNDPDYGFNVVAGTELPKHFLIDVNYGFGLRNLSNVPVTTHNKVWNLSVGYMLR